MQIAILESTEEEKEMILTLTDCLKCGNRMYEKEDPDEKDVLYCPRCRCWFDSDTGEMVLYDPDLSLPAEKEHD